VNVTSARAQGGGLAREQIISSFIYHYFCTANDETNSMVSFWEKRFQRLCRSLRRNDPKVTDISTWGDSLERHSCRTLGKALVNNTVVTTIKIELGSSRICSPMLVLVCKKVFVLARMPLAKGLGWLFFLGY
jgi:hypothetical protein